MLFMASTAITHTYRIGPTDSITKSKAICDREANKT